MTYREFGERYVEFKRLQDEYKLNAKHITDRNKGNYSSFVEITADELRCFSDIATKFFDTESKALDRVM